MLKIRNKCDLYLIKFEYFGQLRSTNGTCYCLNVYVPLKFICWNSNAQWNDIRKRIFVRCLGHERGALMNGINGFIKETPQSTLVTSTVWSYREKTATYEPGPNQAQNLTVWAPWSQMSCLQRNTFLWFVSHPVCGIWLQQPEWTETEPHVIRASWYCRGLLKLVYESIRKKVDTASYLRHRE